MDYFAQSPSIASQSTPQLVVNQSDSDLASRAASESASASPAPPAPLPFSANSKVLPSDNYNSPYYFPLRNSGAPHPVELLIKRFSVWKMLLKQVVYYLKEVSIFKQKTYVGNKALLQSMEMLRKQNLGKQRRKVLKKSMSMSDLGESGETSAAQNPLQSFLGSAFLPPEDHSVMSLSTTFVNTHAALAETQLITYNQLTLKLIPRLENLKEGLNTTLKQMDSVKGSSDFKTKELRMEIAKTGAILSDYICSVELLTKGESRTGLGTLVKLDTEKGVPSKNDPYLLRLKLDLQLKDQLYTEAHLKDAYSELQKKAGKLETILYQEIQTAMDSFSQLMDAESNAVKDNLVSDLNAGFLRNMPTVDWDFFISNDHAKNFLSIPAGQKVSIRKKSDVVYPYQKHRISSCILSGFLDKKSKYLKNYSRFYYVLTFNFLHEFRTRDRKKETEPVNSYRLDHVSVASSSKDRRKFILRVGDSDKYTFRCHSEEVTRHWLECMSDLCSFSNPLERNEEVVDLGNMSDPGLDSSESLELPAHNKGHTRNSSLNLPTFRSVKNLASANYGVPIQPQVAQPAAASTAVPILEPVAGAATTPVPGIATTPGATPTATPGVTPITINSGTSSNSGGSTPRVAPPLSSAGRARIPPDESPGSDNIGDYFNYAAPRPRAALRGQNLRSVSPQPQGTRIRTPTKSLFSLVDPSEPEPKPISGAEKRRMVLESRLKNVPGYSGNTNLNSSGFLQLPNNSSSDMGTGTNTPGMLTPGFLPPSSMGEVWRQDEDEWNNGE